MRIAVCVRLPVRRINPPPKQLDGIVRFLRPSRKRILHPADILALATEISAIERAAYTSDTAASALASQWPRNACANVLSGRV